MVEEESWLRRRRPCLLINFGEVTEGRRPATMAWRCWVAAGVVVCSMEQNEQRNEGKSTDAARANPVKPFRGLNHKS